MGIMFAEDYNNMYYELKNANDMVESLRKRLYKLTGCHDFGNVDGMNGACVDCFHDNKELFDRCEKFKFDKK